VRIRLFHYAIVLLASLAAAEEEPWKADPLDPQALAEARKAIEKDLKQPAKDAPAEEQSWYEARKRRISVLGDLETAVKEFAGLPESEQSEAEKKQFEQELDALRKQPVPPVPDLRETKDVRPYEDAARDATSAAQTAQANLKALKDRSKELEKGLQAAISRTSELKSRIDAAKDAEKGSIQAYKGTTAAIELRRLDLYSKNSSAWRRRYEAAAQRAQAEVDLTREKSNRADERLEAARKALQDLAAREAEQKAAEAKRLADQADREKDPLYRFLASTKAEVADIRSKIDADQTENTRLKRARETEKESLKLYEREYARVESRIASRRKIASTTAEMLHATLMRAKQWRREVVEKSRPRVDQRINDVMDRMGQVQDRYFQAELPPQKQQAWLDLSAKLLPERQEAALAEYTAAIVGQDGLRGALRDRVQSLETTHELLNELDSVYEAQVQELIKLDTLITSMIYWVRTDERLGRHLIEETGTDFANLWDFYTEPEFVDELGSELSKRPYLYATASLLLAGLLVIATLAARRLRRRPMKHPPAGEHLRKGVRDGFRTLVFAVAPSLVLLLGVEMVLRLDLPTRVSFPLQAGLKTVAFLLFIQRLAWGLLYKRGFLVVHFGVKREVGAQILRSVRIYTVAGMLLWLPFRLLDEAPFDPAALTRAFGTGFRICELLSVALLLPRSQPVARAFVAGSEGGLRVLGILNPFIFLGMLLIVLMDLAGYRYGATFFTEQVMETTLVVIVLRALYSGLNQISERVSERVRERAFKEQGGTAAWEDSSAVTRQLTRLITVGVIVTAAVILARSWDFQGTYGRIFEEWKFTEVSDGVFLTAADVVRAIVFIIGAHFLSSNIAGIFELIVFPIFGNVHRGTRFVVLALSRYLILLIGYSAALISVHFSVANLGWLFAAVSVGLGFGLQEIVANFVSGLILLVEQPVRVGDVITVGDTGGTVEKITIRSTVVNDWDQKQIIIPNKAFITQNLINWTRNNNFTRRKIPVSVAYGSDVEKVLKVLEDAVKGVENVRSYPPPRIWFDGFGESGLEFMVWIYVDIDYGFSTMSALRQVMYAALQEAEITIPFPQRDIHIKSDRVEDLQGAAGLNEKPDAQRPAPDA
jgi:potassium efflux system protein